MTTTELKWREAKLALVDGTYEADLVAGGRRWKVTVFTQPLDDDGKPTKGPWDWWELAVQMRGWAMMRWAIVAADWDVAERRAWELVERWAGEVEWVLD